jgi:peptide deformylase
MALLPLVIAPNPIFKQKAEAVSAVDSSIQKLMDDMLETMYSEHGIGIAGNMVGVLKRLVVIDLFDNKKHDPIFMANPEVVAVSEEKQVVEEASICFPGIYAKVSRPKKITVKYLDYNNQPQTLEAEGLLSSCIQHEIDYLDGVTFVDYLSPVKRDVLLRKMKKIVKKGFAPHVHTAACNHG